MHFQRLMLMSLGLSKLFCPSNGEVQPRFRPSAFGIPGQNASYDYVGKFTVLQFD